MEKFSNLRDTEIIGILKEKLRKGEYLPESIKEKFESVDEYKKNELVKELAIFILSFVCAANIVFMPSIEFLIELFSDKNLKGSPRITNGLSNIGGGSIESGGNGMIGGIKNTAILLCPIYITIKYLFEKLFKAEYNDKVIHEGKVIFEGTFKGLNPVSGKISVMKEDSETFIYF